MCECVFHAHSLRQVFSLTVDTVDAADAAVKRQRASNIDK